MPRHPPCALISLNAYFAELCLVLKESLSIFLEKFEIVFTHFLLKSYFTKNLDILISSLLFRYSIFNELNLYPPSF